MMEQVPAFLKAIKENNNREWYLANKEWYNKAKTEFEQVTLNLISELGKIDKDIAKLDVSQCTYRIFRDIRFSPDKTPYKSHMGAYMVKGGKNSGLAGYYFHVEPGSNILAGGVYMPMPPVLKKLRKEIYDNIDEFLEIVENRNFKKAFPSLDNDMKLQKAPLGYPKDFEHIDYLKYKSYTVSSAFDDKLLASPKLIEKTVEQFALMAPFIKFINTALTE
jgi:uncharacterized protein (TIGR02453 family)